MARHSHENNPSVGGAGRNSDSPTAIQRTETIAKKRQVACFVKLPQLGQTKIFRHLMTGIIDCAGFAGIAVDVKELPRGVSGEHHLQYVAAIGIR